MTKVKKTVTTNKTNLKAKAKGNTVKKQKPKAQHLQASNYKKADITKMTVATADFLANRISDAEKVIKYTVPMTKYAVNLFNSYQTKNAKKLTRSELTSLIFDLVGYSKKQQVSAFEMEITNIIKRVFLISIVGYSLNERTGKVLDLDGEAVPVREMTEHLKKNGLADKRASTGGNKTEAKKSLKKLFEDFKGRFEKATDNELLAISYAEIKKLKEIVDNKLSDFDKLVSEEPNPQMKGVAKMPENFTFDKKSSTILRHQK